MKTTTSQQANSLKINYKLKHMKKIILSLLFVSSVLVASAQTEQENLYKAIESDNAEAVNLAITNGADPNLPFEQVGYFQNDGYKEYTPLMKAAAENKLNALTALLAVKKIKINALTDQKSNYQFKLKSLKPESCSTKSIKGKTALMFAAHNGHFEAVQKLIEAGADPLLSMEVNFLIKNGQKRNGQPVDGGNFTAKQLAGENGYEEIEAYLKKAKGAALKGMWK